MRAEADRLYVRILSNEVWLTADLCRAASNRLPSSSTTKKHLKTMGLAYDT